MYKCDVARMSEKIHTFATFGDAGHGGITRSQHNQLCHGAMLAQTGVTRKQNHPGHEKNGSVSDLLVFISVFDRFNKVKPLNVRLRILGVIKNAFG